MKLDKKAIPLTPQRFTWKTVGTYDTYDDAVKVIRFEGEDHKIKRRGDKFEVRKGTTISKEESNN